VAACKRTRKVCKGVTLIAWVVNIRLAIMIAQCRANHRGDVTSFGSAGGGRVMVYL